MNNIEVEIRSFITQQQYETLLKFFKENWSDLKEDYQETFYFDGKDDLRIQKNDFYSKIWMKKWEIHDNHREEIEIKCDKNDFKNLEQLFLTLGYTVNIKRFRKRISCIWQDITVCLDYTKWYWYILELEIMSNETEKEEIYQKLVKKLQSLDINITPKEEFTKQFNYYKQNWKNLI